MAAIEVYMEKFLKDEIKYYQEGQHIFFNNPVKAPVLFFLSEADNLASVPAMKECRGLWRNAGIATEFKLWTKEENAGHL